MINRPRNKSMKTGRQAGSLPKTSSIGADRSNYDEFKIMDAWERFLTGEGDHQEQNNVRPIIKDSWMRSASKGIDAQFERTPQNLDRDEIEHKREKRLDLLTAAERTFNEIGKKLQGTEAMLILTDHDGIILNSIGDKSTLNAGREINLEVGGVWNENTVGTNGIGTALWTGKPVFVHAAEHFCAGIKAWTCAGAPIRDPVDGSVIGVIDLSGPPGIFEERNAALVTTAAQEIEANLATLRYTEWAKLLDSFFEMSGGVGPGDGVILLDQFGRVAFQHLSNDKSKTVLSTAGVIQGQKLLPLSVDMTSSQIFEALPTELRDCSVNVLRKDGVQGAVLVIPDQRPQKRATSLGPQPASLKPQSEIIGEDPEILEKIDMVERLAASNTDTSLLIEGETGVGKELFAKLMHEKVKRDPKTPFVIVNCGAITKELFGGELFGHTSGSFTGALKEGKPGKFELANGGVLCLDEIGELPLDLQPFLLRVLDEGVVYRLGENTPRKINVRLLAMTNRDLQAEVDAGRFRADLYYRIGVTSVTVPPLRDRIGDIELLVKHFTGKFVEEYGIAPTALNTEVINCLRQYDWPGNVRQLRNTVQTLLLTSQGREARLGDVPAIILQHRQDGPNDPECHLKGLEESERQAIVNAITDSQGNLSKAASFLGISRSTLYRKIRQYAIKVVK